MEKDTRRRVVVVEREGGGKRDPRPGRRTKMEGGGGDTGRAG